MNRYQDENWQQEEQRRREAYYRMNNQENCEKTTGGAVGVHVCGRHEY